MIRRSAQNNTASQPGDRQALRRALAYLRAYRQDAIGAFLAVILVSVSNLVTPQLIRIAVDDGIAKHRERAIVLAVVGLVLAAVFRGLFSFLQGYLAERASQGVAHDMRNALFTKLERLSFSYYDRVQTGQLVQRITNDVEQIRTFAGSGIVQLAASVVMLIGSIVLLLLLNWRLALLTLLMVPAIALSLFRFVRRIRPIFLRVQQTLGQLNTVLQEDLAGMKTIRAFRREGHESDRYGAVNTELFDHNITAIHAFASNFPLVGFFANLGTLAVVWYGGILIIDGHLTIGELLAFNSYLGFLLFPILTIGFQSAGIARAGASASRVFEVLDEPLEVHDAPDAVVLPPVTGRVELRDVHFRYPGSEREILSGITFTAEPGQTVAILGTTGSGKSTLIHLLPRFYDVTSGEILIDGYDVRTVTLESLRSQIGIVLQDTLLFSGPVRDNIAYGKPDATQVEIETVAKAAQADEFIRNLPEGYDTIIGERGVGLSGGQRQRIAIARALLLNPRLLILDDSTSAVDAVTEAAIQQALDDLMRDAKRTAFVIAQRISTVRDADVILVLDKGTIAAQGTHEELLLTSPLYNEILGSQLETSWPAAAPAGAAADGGAA